MFHHKERIQEKYKKLGSQESRKLTLKIIKLYKKFLKKHQKDNMNPPRNNLKVEIGLDKGEKNILF